MHDVEAKTPNQPVDRGTQTRNGKRFWWKENLFSTQFYASSNNTASIGRYIHRLLLPHYIHGNQNFNLRECNLVTIWSSISNIVLSSINHEMLRFFLFIVIFVLNLRCKFLHKWIASYQIKSTFIKSRLIYFDWRVAVQK